MAKATLKSIAKIMKGIDLCMLTTVDGRGTTSSRPMSNNGDVDYDGSSYFFTYADTRTVREIKKNPRVSLQLSNTSLVRKNVWISVAGLAELTSDRATMEEHWNKDLEIWFEDGLDTKGITMITVEASHIKYWQGLDEGEFSPKPSSKSKSKSKPERKK